MARYVKVVDGTVVNVVQNETPLNPPWYQSDVAQIGWQYDGVIFFEPAPPPEQPRPISAVEFTLRFSVPESIAIRSSADPIVQEWVRRLDDPRLLELDLNRQEIADGLNYLVSQNLITAERRADLLV